MVRWQKDLLLFTSDKALIDPSLLLCLPSFIFIHPQFPPFSLLLHCECPFPPPSVWFHITISLFWPLPLTLIYHNEMYYSSVLNTSFVTHHNYICHNDPHWLNAEWTKEKSRERYISHIRMQWTHVIL